MCKNESSIIKKNNFKRQNPCLSNKQNQYSNRCSGAWIIL